MQKDSKDTAQPRTSDARADVLASLERLKEEGSFAQAASRAQEWLSAHPSDGETLAQLAHSLMSLRRDAEAAAALQQALQHAPAHPVVQRTLARMLLRTGRRDEADRASEAAYRADPQDPENCVVRAAVLGALQRDDEAVSLFDAALKIRPAYAEAYANRATLRLRQGNAHGAAQDAQEAIRLKPHVAAMWAVLGNAQLKCGNPSEAIAAMRRAGELEPQVAAHRAALGEMLRANRHLQEALAVLGEAVRLDAGNGMAWTNYGIALLEAERMDEAQAAFDRAWATGLRSPILARALGTVAMSRHEWARAIPYLEVLVAAQPGATDALSMLTRASASLAQESGRASEDELAAIWAKAQAGARRLLAVAPTAANKSLLGSVLKDSGHFDEAIAIFQELVQAAPGDAEAQLNLGMTLMLKGRDEEAVPFMQRAVDLRPGYAAALSNLAITLRRLNRIAEAEPISMRAIEADPGLPQAHINRGSVLMALRRYEEAAACAQAAMALDPEMAEAYAEYGNAINNLGDPEGAVRNFKRALELKPALFEVGANMLFQMAWSAVGTPAEYLQEARKWERGLRPSLARASCARKDFRRAPRAGRPLRVGYISGDLRLHAVAKFLEPVFENHDHGRVWVAAYSLNPIFDDASARLKSHCDQWTSLVATKFEDAWRLILRDELDILIDLAGYTRHSGLPVAARRAAPVQAHYIGYFASTGVSAMDYFIADAVCAPPEFDDQFSERLWRLPRPWMSYRMEPGIPEPAWKPADDGSITLGCFNNLTKITPPCVAVWARILKEMPEAKLLLKTGELDSPTNRDRMQAAFAAEGIDAGRLLLQGKTKGHLEHLAMYDRIDIALDPVGAMGGVTTTCDALAMAVPVVTKSGDRLSQRMTSSLLQGLGHSEWIAQTDGAYVAKVIALARDVPLRTALRAAQRAKFAGGPLCDGAAMARALEDAYERMFDAWIGSTAA